MLDKSKILWEELIMLSKELFIKRMNLIQNFYSEQDALSVLIEKIIDGWAIVTIGNELVNEIIDMLNEALNIEDKGFLSWWLYEDVDKIIYYGDKEISVRTLEELYDYLTSSQEGI